MQTTTLVHPLRRRQSKAAPAAGLRLKARHVLSGAELDPVELSELLELGLALKRERARGVFKPWLAHKQLVMLFEKPSLRTRVSFTAAMQDLGGHAIEVLSSNTKHEEPEDTARVLQGFSHGIMARVFDHQTLVRMTSVAQVPVINGLSDLHHPCQSFADAMTLKERFGSLKGLRLAYVGDGNNVLHGLLLTLPALGAEVRYACPQGYAPDAGVVAEAIERARLGGGLVVASPSPEIATQDVEAIYTDVWTSMGFEAETAKREAAFKGYQVNEELMENASPGAVVMHCLPMIRGQEISQTLADQPCSAIFQQSENRLHAQKALLAALL